MFKSLLFTSQFWACAMAYTEANFDKSLNALRKNNNEVADWLLAKDKPKPMWFRHTYHPLCRSDHVTNNISEVLKLGWVMIERK